jgi:hypothetical protein
MILCRLSFLALDASGVSGVLVVSFALNASGAFGASGVFADSFLKETMVSYLERIPLREVAVGRRGFFLCINNPPNP